MRKIAISDIHGCSATFVSLLGKLKLTQKDQLFLLGDYLDRGPSSKQVLDVIFDLQEQGFQLQCLRGNHEEMLLWALGSRGYDLENFLRSGGKQTLQSFGVKYPEDIPYRYLDFLDQLPYQVVSDAFIFVHAGLCFNAGNDPFAQVEKMIWIRNWYKDIDYSWLGNRYIIHGHTPNTEDSIQNLSLNFENKRVLNIDNGCVFELPGYSSLCAYDLTNQQLYFEPRSSEDSPAQK